MNDKPSFLNNILSAKGEPTAPSRGGEGRPHKTSGKEPQEDVPNNGGRGGTRRGDNGQERG